MVSQVISDTSHPKAKAATKRERMCDFVLCIVACVRVCACTQIKCEEFLENYEWLIRSKGVSAFQDMLKKGYSVKLNSVTCDTPTKAANVSNTITQNMGRG